MSEPRVYVYRGSLPLWLALAVALPLGALFLTSLAIAALIAVAGAGVAALLLPRHRNTPRDRPADAIELDPSEYRHIEQRGPRDEQ